ncbi:MAG: hypothetical protein PHR06_04740 [Candidatus Cloacimonetes bacterium]|nr:hypothetical protein [Candidatus Cloacimonadota bacterium]
MLKIFIGIDFFRILSLLSLLIGLVSCQKKQTYAVIEDNGFKTIKNSGIPYNPDLKVELKELFTIQGYDDKINPDTTSFYFISSLQVASDGSIYIFDKISSKILKYSEAGEYLFSFVGKGLGPGEIEHDFSKFYIINDKIIVADLKKHHYFSMNGEYIETRFRENIKRSEKMLQLKNKEYLEIESIVDFTPNETDFSKIYFVSNIKRKNSVFETIAALNNVCKFSASDLLDRDLGTGYLLKITITNNENEIFVANRLKEKYKIDCYDFDFNKTKTMEMRNRIQEYSQKEMEIIEQEHDGYDEEKLKKVFDKKYIINYLHYDNKNNYLIAERAPDLGSLSVRFDVFNSDFVFIAALNVPIKQDDYNPIDFNFTFRIQNGMLYHYEMTENRINVYRIKYFKL